MLLSYFVIITQLYKNYEYYRARIHYYMVGQLNYNFTSRLGHFFTQLELSCVYFINQIAKAIALSKKTIEECRLI